MRAGSMASWSSFFHFFALFEIRPFFRKNGCLTDPIPADPPLKTTQRYPLGPDASIGTTYARGLVGVPPTSLQRACRIAKYCPGTPSSSLLDLDLVMI